MHLAKETFQENLNTRFWLVAEGMEPYAINLVEVINGYSTPKQEQFSLHFRGDRAMIFQQQSYTIKHDAMGEFELFLVPIGRDDSGTLYEAVFNRFIHQEPAGQPQDQPKVQEKAS